MSEGIENLLSFLLYFYLDSSKEIFAYFWNTFYTLIISLALEGLIILYDKSYAYD